MSNVNCFPGAHNRMYFAQTCSNGFRSPPFCWCRSVMDRGAWADVVDYELRSHVRGPFLMSASVYLLWPLWERLVAFAQISDEVMFATMTCVTHSLMYVGVAILFFGVICDRWGYCSTFRLPRPSRSIPSSALIKRAVDIALMDQLFSTPVLLWLSSHYRLIPIAPQSSKCPNFFALCALFCGAQLWHEVLFYLSHRAFHEVPFLYRHIHKRHHEFVGTVAIAAEYAHPLENFLANAIPTTGFLLFVAQAPQPVWAVWLALRMFETYESHSGYCFSTSRCSVIFGLLNGVRAKHHAFHHIANKGNYGGPLMDYFFGTMGAYFLHNRREARLIHE